MADDHRDGDDKEYAMKARHPGVWSDGTAGVMVIHLLSTGRCFTIIYVSNNSSHFSEKTTVAEISTLLYIGLLCKEHNCGSYCHTSGVLHTDLLDWKKHSLQKDCDRNALHHWPGRTLKKYKIHKNLEEACFDNRSQNIFSTSSYSFQDLLCCDSCRGMILVTFVVHKIPDDGPAYDVQIRSDKTKGVPYAGSVQAYCLYFYWRARCIIVLFTAVHLIQQSLMRRTVLCKLKQQKCMEEIYSKSWNEGSDLRKKPPTRDTDTKHSGIFRWFAPTLFARCSRINSFKSLKSQGHLLSRRGLIPTWLTTFIAMPVTRFLPDTSRNPEQDMAYVGYRLATLGALPAACPVSRLRLANAGFYYQGNGDEVVCYSCRGRHRDWTSSDDPVAVHRRIMPNCPHVAELTASTYSASRHDVSSSGAHPGHVAGGSDPDNSEDGEPRFSHAQQHSLPRSEAVDSLNTADTASLSAASGLGLGIQGQAAGARSMFPTPKLDLGGAVYPMYQDMASRQRSFARWDETRAPPLQEVLLNGMFYAGYADCVRCFYCGVGLKSWEPTDSVWSEHIRWRPNCRYLQAVKGEDYIRRVVAQLNRQAENGEDARENVSSVRNDNSTFVLPSRPPVAPSTILTNATTTAAVLADPQPASSSSIASPTTTERQSTPALEPEPETVAAFPSAERQTTAALELQHETEAPSTALLQRHSTSNDRMETDGETRQSGISVVPPSEESELERLDRLRRENRELAGRLQCRVCNRRPIETIFLPCGHLLACEVCTGTLRECPQCHEHIQATARVHMG